jgi:hypothetical protein
MNFEIFYFAMKNLAHIKETIDSYKDNLNLIYFFDFRIFFNTCFKFSSKSWHDCIHKSFAFFKIDNILSVYSNLNKSHNISNFSIYSNLLNTEKSSLTKIFFWLFKFEITYSPLIGLCNLSLCKPISACLLNRFVSSFSIEQNEQKNCFNHIRSLNRPVLKHLSPAFSVEMSKNLKLLLNIASPNSLIQLSDFSRSKSIYKKIHNSKNDDAWNHLIVNRIRSKIWWIMARI